MKLADYVLSEIDLSSKEIMNESYNTACDIIEKFITGEIKEDITINIKN